MEPKIIDPTPTTSQPSVPLCRPSRKEVEEAIATYDAGILKKLVDVLYEREPMPKGKEFTDIRREIDVALDDRLKMMAQRDSTSVSP